MTKKIILKVTEHKPTKQRRINIPKSEKTLEKENSLKQTSEQLTLIKSPTTTYSVADFLARLSVLLGNGKDLKIHEALSSLISQGYSLPKDLDIYFLKMSKDSYHIMTDIRSAQIGRASCRERV